MEAAKSYNSVIRRLDEKEGGNFLFDTLFVVSFVGVFVYTIYQIRLRRTMSYHDLYTSRELLSAIFSYGTIVLGLYYVFKKRYVNFILFMWLWFLVAYFVAGTRSMGIIYFGALFFILPIIKPEFFRKRTYIIWAIAAVLGLASINILSEMRTSSIGSASSLSATDLDIAIFNSINEMGASEYPTIVTMSEVERGHDYPQTILYYLLLGFIPSGLLDALVPKSWTIQLGAWATEAVDSSYEIGYSWIAESYFNYGSYAWLFTMLYGWFIAMAENYSLRIINNGQKLLALCLLAFLCKQIFFARGQIYLSISFYRYSIILAIVYFLFGYKRKNKSIVKF